MQFPNVREHSLRHIWYDSFGFNRYRGDKWMPELCRQSKEAPRALDAQASQIIGKG